MPRSSNILDVLIASPSDVLKERDILTQVILDWNSAHSRTRGVTLSAVRWETNAVPAVGDRPQALLNKQIVQSADIVLGVFWYRLGTPTGQAVSGTAEEIEIMRRNGKHVLLYFSEVPIPHDHDPEQFSSLKKYRDSLKKDTLYWTFSSPEDLRRLVGKHLAAVVNEIIHNTPLNRSPNGAAADTSSEIDLRVDAINVSARFTHSGGDFFSFVLTNESSEAVLVKEIRLFSVDRHSLAQPYILPATSERTITPNGSLRVEGRFGSNPVANLSALNWQPNRGNVQTIPLDFIIEVGCEVLRKFKRYPTKVRAQLDLRNNRLEAVWF